MHKSNRCNKKPVNCVVISHQQQTDKSKKSTKKTEAANNHKFLHCSYMNDTGKKAAGISSRPQCSEFNAKQTTFVMTHNVQYNTGNNQCQQFDNIRLCSRTNGTQTVSDTHVQQLFIIYQQ